MYDTCIISVVIFIEFILLLACRYDLLIPRGLSKVSEHQHDRVNRSLQKSAIAAVAIDISIFRIQLLLKKCIPLVVPFFLLASQKDWLDHDVVISLLSHERSKFCILFLVYEQNMYAHYFTEWIYVSCHYISGLWCLIVTIGKTSFIVNITSNFDSEERYHFYFEFWIWIHSYIN